MGMRVKGDQPSAICVRGLFVGIEVFASKNDETQTGCDDAKSLYRVFSASNSDVTILTNKEATAERILGNLCGLMERAKPGELLLFFVSTQGEIRYNDFFFMPYDGDAEYVLGTGVSSKLLVNALGTVADRGVKVLLVIDTCHSGAIGFDISRSQSENGGGISCLFSASPTETCFDSEQSDSGRFSHHVIEGLRGKAGTDKNGNVTLRDLFDYVYARTQSDSCGHQHPILIGTLENQTPLLKA